MLLMRVTLLLWLLGQSAAYRVLVLGTLTTRSHSILAEAAADILKERGHEVTLITYYPSEKSHLKYRTVSTNEITRMKDFPTMSFSNINKTMLELMSRFYDTIPYHIYQNFEHPEARKILDGRRERFDAVIFPHFENEFLVGLGERFDCPVVLLVSLGMSPMLAALSGNPLSLATVPNFLLPLATDMSLLQRTSNVVASLAMLLIYRVFLWSNQRSYYSRAFPEESSRVPLEQAMRRVALVLTNTHPAVGSPRALLPHTLEVGGFHVSQAEPLPQDLQAILDAAHEGAVYFSMGSVLKSSDMEPATRSALVRALGRLRQTVLWKLEEELPDLQDLPPNIIIRKWMPQASILAHQKVQLFVSHGGLLGVTEATSHGVPLLCLPIFGDQMHNALTLQSKGFGLLLLYSNVTEDSFHWALREMLDNDRYRRTAKHYQSLFLDRPMPPRDVLALHVERAIRTRGNPDLVPPPLSLVQRLLLDVLALAVFVVAGATLVVMAACNCCRKRRHTHKADKKTN